MGVSISVQRKPTGDLETKMENVLAVIELIGVLFKCGVIAGVGFYILGRYRAYREATMIRRAYNRTILRTSKKRAHA